MRELRKMKNGKSPGVTKRSSGVIESRWDEFSNMDAKGV